MGADGVQHRASILSQLVYVGVTQSGGARGKPSLFIIIIVSYVSSRIVVVLLVLVFCLRLVSDVVVQVVPCKIHYSLQNVKQF